MFEELLYKTPQTSQIT